MKKYLFIFVSIVVPFYSFAIEVDFKEVITIALKNSIDVKISEKMVEDSYANTAIENAGRLPNISVVGNVNKTKVGANSQNDVSLGLNLDYNVFNGGKTLNAINIAKNNNKKAIIQHKKNVLNVIVKIAEIYYGVKKSRLLKKSYKVALNNTEQIMDIERIKFNNGATDKTFYLNSQSSYYNNKAKLVDIETILSALNIQYYNLTGTKIPQILPDPDLSALETTHTLEQAIKKAVENNLDVQIAKINMKNSVYSYTIAKAEHSPVVGLNASVKKKSGNNNTVSMGINYSVPLFSGGKNIAKTAKGEILKKQAEMLYKKAKDNAEIAAINAWREYLSSKQELSSYNKSLKSLEMSLEVEKLRYENDTTESSKLLDIQNKKLIAEQMYVSAIEKVAISTLNLSIITGELTMEKLKSIR